MQHMRAEGAYTGGKPPYGQKLSACGRTDAACRKAGGCDAQVPHGVLLDVPEELAVIAAARELRTTGLALHKVGKQLAVRGYLSRAGKVFAAGQVQRMVAGSDTNPHGQPDRIASERTES